LLADLEPLATTWGAYAFVVLLGLLWGSFANVCIYRMPPTEEFPNGRSVVRPGSHCFACKAPVRWYDNVPLLSYVWLRGRCRACKAPFSARYLLVEALTGALFGVAWWFEIVPEFTVPFEARLIHFAIAAAFIVVLVVIAFIDIDHKLILNIITIPSIVVFYALSLVWPDPDRHWWDGLIGIAIGYGVPWLIGTLYFLITKREGLGLGDSTFLALVGALLGWKGVLAALFGGSMIGSVIGIAGVLLRPKSETDDTETTEATADANEPAPSLMKTELPFGPFLAAGALLYLFAQPWIAVNLRFGGG
jgi:leader peptidase (prepilin peptidase)/N-methyltransferase